MALRPLRADRRRPQALSATAVQIRPVTAGDALALRELRLRALSDAPHAFASSVAEEAAFPAERWSALAGQPAAEGVVCVAIAGTRWLGMAAGRWFDQPAGIAHLWGMWVDPAARRGGLGERLVAAVGDWAAGYDARLLRLGVMADLAGLVRFYERLGFERTGETRTLTGDPGRIALFLARSL